MPCACAYSARKITTTYPTTTAASANTRTTSALRTHTSLLDTGLASGKSSVTRHVAGPTRPVPSGVHDNCLLGCASPGHARAAPTTPRASTRVGRGDARQTKVTRAADGVTCVAGRSSEFGCQGGHGAVAQPHL